MHQSLTTIVMTLALAAGFVYAEEKGHEGHNHAKHAVEGKEGHGKMAAINIADKALNGMKPLEQAAYGIGQNIGKSMGQELGDIIDVKFVIQGLTDAFKGNPSKVSREELTKAFAVLDARMSSKGKAAGSENVKAGEEFLKANAVKEGVKTTASGLQYKITKEGTGKSPKATDTVRVHYNGTLLNGSKFDSSYDRGQPFETALNQVIPGWTEGLQLLKEGSKATLWIPGNLAYGSRGGGSKIPPNATLIFEIELLEVK